jgi:Ca2+-binding RTX toxin-like protein
VLVGGGGTKNEVTYATRGNAVTVTIDGTTNDGESGEGDNVHTDIQRIIGGSGNDSITAGTSSVTLWGGDGDDTLYGSDLADSLLGENGDDYVGANAGDDTIDGGAGVDRMLGNDGNDTFYARDGVQDNLVSGGPGTDQAQIDSSDPTSSIETILP